MPTRCSSRHITTCSSFTTSSSRCSREVSGSSCKRSHCVTRTRSGPAGRSPCCLRTRYWTRAHTMASGSRSVARAGRRANLSRMLGSAASLSCSSSPAASRGQWPGTRACEHPRRRGLGGCHRGARCRGGTLRPRPDPGGIHARLQEVDVRSGRTAQAPRHRLDPPPARPRCPQTSARADARIARSQQRSGTPFTQSTTLDERSTCRPKRQHSSSGFAFRPRQGVSSCADARTCSRARCDDAKRGTPGPEIPHPAGAG